MDFFFQGRRFFGSSHLRFKYFRRISFPAPPWLKHQWWHLSGVRGNYRCPPHTSCTAHSWGFIPSNGGVSVRERGLPAAGDIKRLRIFSYTQKKSPRLL